MTYKEASKQLKRVGTSRAQGDALRAMYADLVAVAHGGMAVKYYEALQSTDDSEQAIRHAALPMIRDRATAWDTLMGVS